MWNDLVGGSFVARTGSMAMASIEVLQRATIIQAKDTKISLKISVANGTWIPQTSKTTGTKSRGIDKKSTPVERWSWRHYHYEKARPLIRSPHTWEQWWTHITHERDNWRCVRAVWLGRASSWTKENLTESRRGEGKLEESEWLVPQSSSEKWRALCLGQITRIYGRD